MTAPGPPRPGRSRGLLLAALLALVLAGYLAHAGRFAGQLNDDAFITFRYSRSLASGAGPYYNPGERVEGYSNFLLMALLAPVIALGGSGAALSAAKGIGLAAGAAAILLAFALARGAVREGAGRGEADAAGLAAALVIAASPGYALNSTTGLETTLFAALLAAGTLLGVRALGDGRWRGSGVAFAAAALTRTEGAAVFAAFWAVSAAVSLPAIRARLRAGEGGAARRLASEPLVRDLLLVVAVVAAHLAFRLAAYDGAWLPNSVAGKIGGFWKTAPWAYLRAGLVRPLLGSAGLAAAVAGLALLRGRPGALAAVASVPAAGAVLLAAGGTDWMPGQRLLVPYLPLAAVVAARGWIALAARVPGAGRAGPAAAVALVAALALSTQGDARTRLERYVDLRAEGYRSGHAALAAWIGERARPGDTVALMDIGIVGYALPEQRILDLTGLTDRRIAASPGTFLRKVYDPAYIFGREPSFIVLVLVSPGDPAQPPAAGAPWKAATIMESRILRSPEFIRSYALPAAPSPGTDWREALRARVGASAVFEHLKPGEHYVLAVFERRG